MTLLARTKPRRGFTLIELLVVIAIIAILAAILFPVFAKVRENARRTACQSNMKQIALGLIQYQQDADELFPRAWFGPAGYGDSDATANYKWMDAVYPFIKSNGVFTCPDDPSLFAQYTYRTDHHWGSYAMNGTYTFIDCSLDKGFGIQGTNIAQLSAPTQTVLINEVDANISAAGTHTYNVWFNSPGCPNGGVSPTLTTTIPREWNYGGSQGYPIERHSSTTNVAFCDGHVKSLLLDKLTETAVDQDGRTRYLYYSANPGAQPY